MLGQRTPNLYIASVVSVVRFWFFKFLIFLSQYKSETDNIIVGAGIALHGILIQTRKIFPKL